MKRIFLTLGIFSTLLLAVAFVLGFSIDDPQSRDAAVQQSVRVHLWTAMLAVIVATLLHAVVLTYFMGTSRWMEETSRTYQLGDRWQTESSKLKYRTLPGMMGALLLLILVVGFGGAADPASPVDFKGFAGLSAGAIHYCVALTTVAINLMVNVSEFQAISRNSELVDEVLQEVRRIREERGLPV